MSHARGGYDDAHVVRWTYIQYIVLMRLPGFTLKYWNRVIDRLLVSHRLGSIRYLDFLQVISGIENTDSNGLLSMYHPKFLHQDTETISQKWSLLDIFSPNLISFAFKWFKRLARDVRVWQARFSWGILNISVHSLYLNS